MHWRSSAPLAYLAPRRPLVVSWFLGLVSPLALSALVSRPSSSPAVVVMNRERMSVRDATSEELRRSAMIFFDHALTTAIALRSSASCVAALSRSWPAWERHRDSRSHEARRLSCGRVDGVEATWSHDDAIAATALP